MLCRGSLISLVLSHVLSTLARSDAHCNLAYAEFSSRCEVSGVSFAQVIDHFAFGRVNGASNFVFDECDSGFACGQNCRNEFGCHVDD